MSIVIFYLWNDLAAGFDWRPISAPLPSGAVPCAVVVEGLIMWRDVPRCESWQYAQYVALEADAVRL